MFDSALGAYATTGRMCTLMAFLLCTVTSHVSAQRYPMCPPTTGIQFPAGHTASVRIAGGSSRGILEMSFDGANWDAVCDDVLDQNNNAVSAICMQMGFDGGTYTHFTTTHGAASFAADDVYCPEGATRLNECTMSPPYSHNCIDSETVGIDCGKSRQCAPTWSVSRAQDGCLDEQLSRTGSDMSFWIPSERHSRSDCIAICRGNTFPYALYAEYVATPCICSRVHPAQCDALDTSTEVTYLAWKTQPINHNCAQHMDGGVHFVPINDFHAQDQADGIQQDSANVQPYQWAGAFVVGCAAIISCLCSIVKYRRSHCAPTQNGHSISDLPATSDLVLRNPIFDAVNFSPSSTITFFAGGSADTKPSVSTATIDTRNGCVYHRAETDGPVAPQSYFCPITQEIMRDPVLLGDGHSYERLAILQWLQSSKRSPMTNTTLPPEMRIITPNHTLRSMILEYVEAFVCAYPPVSNVDTHADDSIGTMNPAHLAAGVLEQPASVLSGSGNENVTTSVEMHGEVARSRLDQIKRIFRSREEIQPTPGIMPQRRVAPYTLGEFTRLNQPGFTAYTGSELAAVRVLLDRHAPQGGLTLRILAQYNISCPRRFALDRQRREAYRQAAAVSAVSTTRPGSETHFEPEPE